MIFAKTWQLVLSGRKTQTTRLAYAGDYLAVAYPGCPDEYWSVFDSLGRTRWRTGRTYAVQPERCHPARGRILCTSLTEVLNPLEVDVGFVVREGFDTATEYLRVWHELHRRKPVQRCWAIGFELVREEAEPPCAASSPMSLFQGR